jgi:ADP-ribose pyrophosphatase YjhB (NUDIX family)
MKVIRESIFEQEINDPIKLSAGLAIIQNGSILLGHPTGSKWYGTYSIPKGEVEKGEDLLTAAIRETREEIGLSIDPKDVKDTEPRNIDYKDKSGKVYKRVYYFIVNPPEPISSDALDPDKKEIDWAGFILKDKAEQRIFWRLKPILDEIEEVKETPTEEEKPAEEKPAEEEGGGEFGL